MALKCNWLLDSPQISNLLWVSDFAEGERKTFIHKTFILMTFHVLRDLRLIRVRWLGVNRETLRQEAKRTQQMHELRQVHMWENVGIRLMQNPRRSLHGQSCCRHQELTSHCTCEDVPFTQMERFHILEDCLTSGEKSLVCSSVPLFKYIMVFLWGTDFN